MKREIVIVAPLHTPPALSGNSNSGVRFTGNPRTTLQFSTEYGSLPSVGANTTPGQSQKSIQIGSPDHSPFRRANTVNELSPAGHTTMQGSTQDSSVNGKPARAGSGAARHAAATQAASAAVRRNRLIVDLTVFPSPDILHPCGCRGFRGVVRDAPARPTLRRRAPYGPPDPGLSPAQQPEKAGREPGEIADHEHAEAEDREHGER